MTSIDERVDFHAQNAVGTILATFDNPERAKAWVKQNIERFPSLRVVEVTTRVVKRTLYRPRVMEPA